MSYLSRTQKAIYPVKVGGNELVRAEFANKLERECDELRAALVISEKKEMATRAVIESWKQGEGADAARLEWLVQRDEAEFSFRGSRYDLTRYAIDKAMEETRK